MKKDSILSAKTEKLLNHLDDKASKSQVQAEAIVNPMVHLKNTLADFTVSRITKIQEEATFEKFLIDQIKKKITDNPSDVKLSEIGNLLNQTKIRNTESVQVLLEFFKPSQSEKPPLFEEASEESTEDSLHSETDYKVLQALEQISNFIQDTSNKKEVEDAKVTEVSEESSD